MTEPIRWLSHARTVASIAAYRQRMGSRVALSAQGNFLTFMESEARS